MSAAKPYLSDTVLLADDEPMYLGFLADFLKAKGFEVDRAETADEAIEKAKKNDYRCYIVDLNIPASEQLKSEALIKSLESDFPGMSIARKILTLGTSPKRVLIYSVHLTDPLFAEIHKLGIQYIQKGRPKIIKEALLDIFQNDPKAPQKSQARK